MSKQATLTVGEVLSAYRQFQQSQQSSLSRLQSTLRKLDDSLSPEELQTYLAGGHLNGVPAKGLMLTQLSLEDAYLDMLKLVALVRPEQVLSTLTPAVAAASDSTKFVVPHLVEEGYRPASRRLSAISTNYDVAALELFESSLRQQILEGAFETTAHFQERLVERDITIDQVLEAIRTGTAVNSTAEFEPSGKKSGLRVTGYVGARKLAVGLRLDNPPTLLTAYWQEAGHVFSPLGPAEARVQVVHVLAVTPTEVTFQFDGNRRTRKMWTDTDYSNQVEAGKSYLVETVRESGRYRWRSIQEVDQPAEATEEAAQVANADIPDPEPAPAEQ